jgi:4'-phosphopantetheinyl transferase
MNPTTSGELSTPSTLRAAPIILPDDEIHLWQSTLDLPPSSVERLLSTLSVDEVTRADRFYFARDRLRFVAGRAIMRDILGRYLNCRPEQISFVYNSYGKPGLDRSVACTNIQFNLSHSSGRLVLAVGRRRLGIDLEKIRPGIASEDVAAHFFAPAEVCELATVPVLYRVEAFFNCWTRKEAYVKARGEGLSTPLDAFEVSLAPGEPARLIKTVSDDTTSSGWALQALEPHPGFVAAIVAEKPEWTTRLIQWSDPARF